jgi:hypothetical protein
VAEVVGTSGQWTPVLRVGEHRPACAVARSNALISDRSTSSAERAPRWLRHVAADGWRTGTPCTQLQPGRPRPARDGAVGDA